MVRADTDVSIDCDKQWTKGWLAKAAEMGRRTS